MKSINLGKSFKIQFWDKYVTTDVPLEKVSMSDGTDITKADYRFGQTRQLPPRNLVVNKYSRLYSELKDKVGVLKAIHEGTRYCYAVDFNGESIILGPDEITFVD